MGNIQQQLNQTLRTASVSIGAIKGAGQLDAKQRLAQERETFGVEKKNLLQRIKMADAKTEELKSAAKVMQDRLNLFKQKTVLSEYEKNINAIKEKYKEQEDK